MDLKLPLACVLIAGGALGALLPHGDTLKDPAGTPKSAAAPADDPPLVAMAQAPAPSGWGGPVSLPRERDGHFYADIEVEGESYRMLVDTGASVVALTGEDAERMGIAWDSAEIEPVAQGASGPVYGVRTRIERMALGPHEASGIAAIVVPEGLAISLLGQTFLGTIGKVEIADDRMVLGE